MSLRYSKPLPRLRLAGHVTEQALAGLHTRYIELHIFRLTCRPAIAAPELWSIDLTQSYVTIAQTTVYIRPRSHLLPHVLRFSQSLLQVWRSPLLEVACGVHHYYILDQSRWVGEGWMCYRAWDRHRERRREELSFWKLPKSGMPRWQKRALRGYSSRIIQISYHPFSVPIIDVFESCHEFHMITPRVRGMSLEVVSVFQKMPKRTVQKAMHDILTVLNELHQVGAAHGTVMKSVLVDENNECHLLVHAWAGIRKGWEHDIRATGQLFYRMLTQSPHGAGHLTAQIVDPEISGLLMRMLTCWKNGITAASCLQHRWFKDVDCEFNPSTIGQTFLNPRDVLLSIPKYRKKRPPPLPLWKRQYGVIMGIGESAGDLLVGSVDPNSYYEHEYARHDPSFYFYLPYPLKERKPRASI